MTDTKLDKANYLSALAEHGLYRAACKATGLSVGQVWTWRALDAAFDAEFRRIWLKSDPAAEASVERLTRSRY